MTAAQWCFDPTTLYQHRYWNGMAWTDDVADLGNASREPIATGLPRNRSGTASFTRLAAPVTAESIDMSAAMVLAQGYNDFFRSRALCPYLTGWSRAAGSSPRH